jgi:methyl-accepting chemotaxis protein
VQYPYRILERKSNVYDVYTLIKKDDSHTKFVLASYAPKSTL